MNPTTTVILFTLFAVLVAALITTLRKAEKYENLYNARNTLLNAFRSESERLHTRIVEFKGMVTALEEQATGQSRIIRDMTRVNAGLNQRIADLEVDAALPTNPDHKS